MSWSKVKKGKKPIMWWYHKLLCELGYYLHIQTSQIWFLNMYHNHLNIMIKKYKFNLYGEEWETF